MHLLVGLGNPGSRYFDNRHNIGFLAADEIARAQGFGPWRKGYQGQVSEGRLGGEKVLLLKPETFMNESGRAVGEAVRFFKLEPDQVTVLYDEIDLAPGKVKVRTGGGAAGHNGIRSIINHVGGDFHRVRLGIGHPGHKDQVKNYVLSDFSKADDLWLDPLLEEVARQAALLVGEADTREQDFGLFMTKLAAAVPQAKKKPESEAKEDG